MKRILATFLPLLLCISLLLSACGALSKGERARAMERELEEKIKKGVPVGASRVEVEAFIDGLSVDGSKPKRKDYSKDFSKFDTGSRAPQKPKEMPPGIVGHVIAEWEGVDSDSSIMYNIGLYAIFYFDDKDHLVAYSVQRYFWH